MARSIRIEYPGAVYHIPSQGNAGEPISLEDEDRKRLLTVLEEVEGLFRQKEKVQEIP